MAQATGYVCDRCGAFEVAVRNTSSIEKPKGWVTVMPSGGDGALDVCSNACLAETAILRYEAETNKRFMRTRRDKVAA